MPDPKKNEKKNDFISRCITDKEMNEKFKDKEQRLAVCYSYWNKKLTENVFENLKTEILEFKIEVGPKGYNLIDNNGKTLSIDNLPTKQKKVFDILKIKLKKDGYLQKIAKEYDSRNPDIVLMSTGVRVNDEDGKQIKFYEFK